MSTQRRRHGGPRHGGCRNPTTRLIHDALRGVAWHVRLTGGFPSWRNLCRARLLHQAQRRAGQMLADMPKQTGGDAIGSVAECYRAAANISRNRSQMCTDFLQLALVGTGCAVLPVDSDYNGSIVRPLYWRYQEVNYEVHERY